MTTGIALGLLAVSVALLGLGGFIQFDDTSGFGSYQWVMPLGALAGLTAMLSVMVAVRDRTARRSLGAALLVLDALLVVASLTDDGFRFVYGGGEGELLYLQVAVALCGLILVTSRLHSTPLIGQPTRSLVPHVDDTCGVVLLAFVGFVAGVRHFEATQCSGRGAVECDVAVLEGVAWVVAVIVGSAIAIIVLEVKAHRRRGTCGHPSGV